MVQRLGLRYGNSAVSRWKHLSFVEDVQAANKHSERNDEKSQMNRKSMKALCPFLDKKQVKIAKIDICCYNRGVLLKWGNESQGKET